jgi:hypothetical protein
MSRGRETRHTAMVLACVALMAVSTGCRQSPFQRLAAGTVPEPSPAGKQPEIPRLLPVPEQGSRTVPATVPETGSGTETMSGPIALAPAPTPLLDAALKQAAAVEQLHREAILASDSPSASTLSGQPDAQTGSLAAATGKSVRNNQEPVRSFKLASSVPESTPPAVASKAQSRPSGAASPVPDLASSPGSAPGAAPPLVRNQVVDLLASAAAKPANQALIKSAVATITDAVKAPAKDDSTRPAEIRSAALALEDRAPLGATELRLCRKVYGFGSIEPLPASALKAGQPILIYCELTGLRYQAREAGYVSRLSSRVELVSARDGTTVWEQSLGEAEDECRSRRRDNYVNYRIILPPTLPAGDYRLRLTQTDLVANHSASSELPLTVTR